MIYKILLVGGGQLGSRYLQGLSLCRNHLKIFVLDNNIKSLKNCELRWNEVSGNKTKHIVDYSTDFSVCPKIVDLAIIATTAKSRAEVVRKLSQFCRINFWIMEKVLAVNSEDLSAIEMSIGENSFAWVNNPRRIIPWHQEIKGQLNRNYPMELLVNGGPWGLACNSIHFLDLIAWWSGEKLKSICTSDLEIDWWPAKRPGNWEICGTLKAQFSDGSKAVLNSVRSGEATYLYCLKDAKDTWSIDEEKGTAKNTNGLEINGRVPFQSEMTAALVDQILCTGKCLLPSLTSSVSIHRIFIEAMLAHWRDHHDPTATFIPIT
jgi:hypothetical protein